MSISFDAAVASLKVMFPDWDEETLSTLLIANNYHVERTIETILTMLGDPNASSVVESSQPPPPVIQSRPVPAPAPRYATLPAAVAPLTSLQPPELHQTASGTQLSRIISQKRHAVRAAGGFPARPWLADDDDHGRGAGHDAAERALPEGSACCPGR